VNITWSNVTLNSDKWVCVRLAHENENEIVIIDLDEPSNIQRHKATAEAAIMHPEQGIIALKGTLLTANSKLIFA